MIGASLNSVVLSAAMLAAAMLVTPVRAWAAETGGDELSALVRAHIRCGGNIVLVGRAIWVEFSIANLTDDVLTLRPPGVVTNEAKPGEMGLPMGHVFSGAGFSALAITNAYGEPIDAKVVLEPTGGAPAVRLSPAGSVGLRVDLTRHYPSLRRPGEYTLVWQPYQGGLTSEPLTITVMAERQAVITTDYGKMTMRFHYDEAPHHVENFIELVNKGFYYNLTFHRIVPGGIVQGGDPRGDGRGIRPDGKQLKAEFNNIPFEMGTIGMARSPRDPDSASCQFYICLARQQAFDGKQTAFAHLVGEESFETLRQTAAVPTDAKDRPKQPVYIRAISLESIPQHKTETKPVVSSAQGKADTSPPPPVVVREKSTHSPMSQHLVPPHQGRGLRAAWRGSSRTRPAGRPDG